VLFRSFDYRDVAQIIDEVAQVAPIYGGVSYVRLESPDGVQWPCQSPSHAGTPLLYADGFPSGKARLAPIDYKAPRNGRSEYPLALTIDPALYQFDSGTWTRLTPGLQQLRGEELAELNPEDARRLGVAEGQRVRIVSVRGQLEAKAKLTDGTLPGQVALTGQFWEVPTHQVTEGTLEPVGKGPTVQSTRVRVEKV
jgi:formate dehydrogenase major subunit/formate dehydrogenase alpha subunit